MSDSLGTARWATENELYQLKYNGERRGKDADFIIGLSSVNVKYSLLDVRRETHFIAGRTDQHALICMGPRAGKGTSILVPNLVLWRGSCVVIDPKGENATITARRRGNGSEYAHGMGQKVHILDPFGVVTQISDDMRARFNPLQEILEILKGPRPDDAVDAAGQIADAIVVQDNDKDAFWQESARYLLKGLILHVVTAPEFEGRRTLVSVRSLLLRGDWLGIEAVRRENQSLAAQGDEPITEPDPFSLLWLAMVENPAFDGIVSGVGSSFQSMADRERSSVLSTANRQTEFIESPAMRRSLEDSDFRLSDLKTDSRGISIYLSLPTRYMGTHYRWLRMFVTLMLDEMERIAHQPKSGYPVLMVLDEFPGLRRMRRIEDATAQIPGYGVKLAFVVQSLTQLKEIYKDNWETFVTSSGIRVFAANEDPFTLRYLSQRLGQREIIRTVQSTGQGSSSSTSASYQPNQFLSTGSNTSSNSNYSSGTSQQIHKHALMTEDELALTFSATSHLSLAMVPGYYPAQLFRMKYYEMPAFRNTYDPHPDHPRPRTIYETQNQPPEPPTATSTPSSPATSAQRAYQYLFNPQTRFDAAVATSCVVALMVFVVLFFSNPRTIFPTPTQARIFQVGLISIVLLSLFAGIYIPRRATRSIILRTIYAIWALVVAALSIYMAFLSL
jgi:type IV secretory pathway TraG/TraD family ATPase VirD4